MKTFWPEDWRMLELFTWKLRVVSRQQLDALGTASRKSVKRLLGNGFLAVEDCLVHVPVLDHALETWKPGMPSPTFAALAWQLEQRRHQATPSRTCICWATRRAVHFVGGCGGKIRQPFQVEHDLGVGAMFFRRCDLKPETWAQWLGEDVFRQAARSSQKIPDALLCATDDEPQLALEYGGLYAPDRLKCFHRHCVKNALPYEIW